MARILGLDVGDRRVGVAVSDALGLIARPLSVIDRGRSGGDDAAAAARIAALVGEHGAAAVVAGEPRRTDGRASAQAERVRAFLDRIRPLLPVPLIAVNEQYSTQEARDIMAARGRKTQPREPDDAVAAAVILQRYLDASRPESGGEDEPADSA